MRLFNGALVHYVMKPEDYNERGTYFGTGSAHHRAALVVESNDHQGDIPCPEVNLMVFPDGMNDGHVGPIWKTCVRYSEGMEPGTFHFPERAVAAAVPLQEAIAPRLTIELPGVVTLTSVEPVEPVVEKWTRCREPSRRRNRSKKKERGRIHVNQSIPLSVVLLVLAGGGVFYLVCRWVSAIQKSAQRISESATNLGAALAASTTALNQAIAAFAPVSAEVQSNIAAVPKVLEAITRVGQAQLEIMHAQRAAHEQQPANQFGRPNGPIPPRDTDAANLEYEVNQMMRAEGISREEAILRMNPANQGSVWDGNEAFKGWR